MKQEMDFLSVTSDSGQTCIFLIDQDLRSRLAFKRFLLSSTLEKLCLSEFAFQKTLKFSEKLIREDAERAAQDIE